MSPSVGKLYGGLWLLAVILCVIRDWLAGVGLGVVLFALYLLSLRYDVMRACRRCGGSNKRSAFGWLFPGTYHHGCGSRWCYGGSRVRWGAWVFMPGRARAERSARGGG